MLIGHSLSPEFEHRSEIYFSDVGGLVIFDGMGWISLNVISFLFLV